MIRRTDRSSPRRHHVLRGLGLAALALAMLPALGASAAEDPDRPGLPFYEGDFNLDNNWQGVRSNGNASAVAARQWVRLSPQAMAAYVKPRVSLPPDRNCTRHPPFETINEFNSDLFATSPAEAPDPYGYFATTRVRTVAFGSLPVEATLTMRQLRDEEDLPVPLTIRNVSSTYCEDRGLAPTPSGNGIQNRPAEVEGELIVAIESLSVDSVPLQLTGRCESQAPAALTMTSNGYYTDGGANTYDADLNPVPRDTRPGSGRFNATPFYAPTSGGLLFGEVDIPSFVDCVVAGGDDLSPLITATVSGPGNPLTMRVTGIDRSCAPYQSEPGDCGAPDNIPFPEEAPE